uniref:Secreted protein n=1 Tax=Nelumbo nucifera TaxID=4432 RepID=A0A822ZD55_NELNU|nr:TPA_asm: hypothetical protein HUJ06_015668 [Nelumbo nucifera]
MILFIVFLCPSSGDGGRNSLSVPVKENRNTNAIVSIVPRTRTQRRKPKDEYSGCLRLETLTGAVHDKYSGFKEVLAAAPVPLTRFRMNTAVPLLHGLVRV